MELTSLVPYNPEVDDIKKEVIEFCISPRQKEEILRHIKVEVKPLTIKKYITSLVKNRYIQPVLTRNLKPQHQQYTATTKGLSYIRSLE